MRKSILTLLAIACAFIIGKSQAPIQQSYPAATVSEIHFDARYGDVKWITTDDKEIQITGTATINFGDNNEWFQIESRQTGSTLEIYAKVSNEDQVDRMIEVHRGDEVVLLRGGKNWEDVQKIVEDKMGVGGYDWISNSRAIKINLRIAVPQAIKIFSKTHFGDNVLENVTNSATIVAHHGSISADCQQLTAPDYNLNSKHDYVQLLVPKAVAASLELTSKHGLIYTNFESRQLAIDKSASSEDQLIGTLNKGGNTKISLQSKHDNIYLRGM